MIDTTFFKFSLSKFIRKFGLLYLAAIDFLFTFFPMVILMFVMVLRDGSTDNIARSSDLAYLVATLYAEIAWRGRLVNPVSLWLPVGMIGSVLASVLAALTTLAAKEGADYEAIKEIIKSGYYLDLIIVLYFFALISAICVRLIPLWIKDDEANPWPNKN